MSIVADLQSIKVSFKKTSPRDVYEKFLAVQEKALELQEENNNLKQEIEKLWKKLEINDSIEFEENVYWIKNKEGNVIDGPFCPKCYDDEKLLMHLIRSAMNSNIKRCPKCKFVIQKLLKD
jgi:uncharacterized Zn finger protein